MSYILDALKKSEQERGHGTAPSVQTLHTSGLGYHSSKTHMWPYLLLGAVFVNLVALVYFIVADTRPDQPPQILSGTTETVAQETDLAPTAGPAGRTMASIDDATIYKPVVMPVAPRMPAAPPIAKQPVAFEVAATPAAEPVLIPQSPIIERHQLPADIQQHIPIMEFSAHVYSSNPVHRSIVINGRFMEEGDRLASDLTLSEITPKGAIFDFQGHLFHQSVVSAWN